MIFPRRCVKCRKFIYVWKNAQVFWNSKNRREFYHKKCSRGVRFDTVIAVSILMGLLLLTGCTTIEISEIEIGDDCDFKLTFDNQSYTPDGIDMLNNCTIKLK